jgi:adenine-specific DNA-methyltransferase
MPAALRSVVEDVDARLVLLSYNDEAWVSIDELIDTCATRGDVAILGIDQPRYVGARIGIHNPLGEKVGAVSHLRNTELVLAAGAPDAVRAAIAAGVESAADAGLLARVLDLDEAKGAAATAAV